MFKLFSKREGQPPVSLIVDIGSASVATGLVSFPDEGIPVVHYSTRTQIAFSNEQTKEQYAHAAFSALLTMLIEVQEHCKSENIRGNPLLIESIACFSPPFGA